jgi:hypothetical protein
MADHPFTGTLSVTDKIGIGTENPIAQLHISSSTPAPSQAFLESGGALLKLSVDANGAKMGTDNAFSLSILTDGSSRIAIDAVGNVGIGVTTPSTQLDVNGTIKATSFLGNGATLDGIVKKAGDTITGTLIVNSTIAAQNISIVNAPGTGLEINKSNTNNLALTINSSGAGWGSGMQFKNTAPNAKTYGIYSGSDGRWHFSDVNNNIDRLVVDKSGNVGISTISPLAPLHILGGNWNPNDSEGDLRIGDETYKFKIGIARGGAGAGDVRIRAQGGTSRLTIGSGIHDVLTVQSTSVGIGTITPSDTLDVAGNLRILSNSNPIRFTSTWSGFPDPVANRAEICNDTTAHKTLMIVGNQSAEIGRRVSIWDRLEVNGRMSVSDGVIQKGGNPITNTADLGLYSQAAGYWMRFVTTGAGFWFFSDGGAGSNPIMTIDYTGNLTVGNSLYVNNLPFADRRNVQWDDRTKQFCYDNSSRRSKENITPLVDEFTKLLAAEPKIYTRPAFPDTWEIGYIAEEFHDLGLDKLVQYNEDGSPGGINYPKLSLYLLEIIKGHERTIRDCEERIKQLEQQ